MVTTKDGHPVPGEPGAGLGPVSHLTSAAATQLMTDPGDSGGKNQPAPGLPAVCCLPLVISVCKNDVVCYVSKYKLAGTGLVDTKRGME